MYAVTTAHLGIQPDSGENIVPGKEMSRPVTYKGLGDWP